jgi:O-antigen/teichoic acid export membrane protein
MATVLAMGLRLIAGILVARYYGAAGRGDLAIILLILAQGVALGQMGVPTYLITATARRKLSASQVAFLSISLAAALGLLADVVAAGLLATIFRSRLATLSLSAALVAILAIPIQIVLRSLEAVFRGYGYVRVAHFTAAIVSVGFLGATIVAVVETWSLGSLLLARVVVLTAIVLGLVLLSRRFNHIARPTWRGLQPKEIARFSGLVHLGSVMRTFRLGLEIVILTVVATPTDVGLYAVALSIVELLSIVPGVLAPIVMQSAASGRKARDVLIPSFQTAVIVTGGMTVVVLAAAGWIVPQVFGSSFEPAVTAVRLLGALALSQAIASIATAHLVGVGRADAPLVVNGLAALVGVAVGIPLAATWGINGAAAGASVGAVTACLVALVYLRRQVGGFGLEFLVIRPTNLRALGPANRKRDES